MPIYEYECEKGHRTERIVSIAYAGAIGGIQCDQCYRFAHRVISAPAPPVMGGMVYRPDPNKPLSTRAEVKVPLKDLQRRDDAIRANFLKRSGKKQTANPNALVKP